MLKNAYKSDVSWSVTYKYKSLGMESQGHVYISEWWQVYITIFICEANCSYAEVLDNKAALACYE